MPAEPPAKKSDHEPAAPAAAVPATHVSVFEIFKIGLGPSSSHAVGPMLAGKRFADELTDAGARPAVRGLTAELFGSLALTGAGHGTPGSLLAGLEGHEPSTVDPAVPRELVDVASARGTLRLAGGPPVPFDYQTDFLWHRRRSLPAHPNGLRITARGEDGAVSLTREYYSIGGGFVVRDDELAAAPMAAAGTVPHPFDSGAELLAICEATGLPVSGVVRANEAASRTADDLDAGLDRLWAVMKDCVAAGCRTPGTLPGALKVPRRAPALFQKLSAGGGRPDPLAALDWVNLWALAVNEENAAGGRVVTAPTNGAAGIVPAVLHYYMRFVRGAAAAGVRDFLLTAAAVASLYKKHASLSGAEVGCQGEVGVACSMAAAGLAEVTGGTPRQVEQAAEIGMEHNLGLTCDPVGGLVQVPCIERNAMGAVKAVNAARLALCGDGTHSVSLDRVIRVMRRTGRDMSAKYKETSRGGLAVNVTEC